MISKKLYDDYTNNNCFFTLNEVLPESTSVICKTTFNKILSSTKDLVNWYDLYRPQVDLFNAEK